MFSRVLDLFSSRSAPSALLVLSTPNVHSVSILHVVPEDGTIEQFSYSNSSHSSATIRCRGVVELSRGHLGTVTLHPGDHQSSSDFLAGVANGVRKILDSTSTVRSEPQETDSVQVSRLVEHVLKPAALDAIHALEGRAPSMNAMQTYHVYVVYIKRSSPGRIIDPDNLTSFG